MPFDDDVREVEARPALAYLCQRCGSTHREHHDAPSAEVALRRAIESGTLHTFHRCRHDSGLGLCRLVGEATNFANAAEAREAGKAAA